MFMFCFSPSWSHTKNAMNHYIASETPFSFQQKNNREWGRPSSCDSGNVGAAETTGI
jgi:hypothetical protein